MKRKTFGKIQNCIIVLNLLNVILKNQRVSGNLANFALVIKNSKIAIDDIGPLIEENVEKDGHLKESNIRILYMDNGKILTACFSFSWIWGWLAVKKFDTCALHSNEAL